jgi:hypothetical protein
MAQRARAWGAAACLVVGVGGCADQQESLIVLHSPAFEQGECSANPNASEILQGGVLDVSYGTPYTLPVVLLNNLRPRSSNTSSGVDDSELQLRDVDVVLRMEQAPEVLRRVSDEDRAFVEFSAPLASQSLPPGKETGVLVKVIGDGASRALRQAIADLLPEGARPTVVAEVTFHATRSGNSRGSLGVIDARAYTFPIELCMGCLPVSCETCPEEACPSDATFAGICGNAQDGTLVPTLCDPID